MSKNCKKFNFDITEINLKNILQLQIFSLGEHLETSFETTNLTEPKHLNGSV